MRDLAGQSGEGQLGDWRLVLEILGGGVIDRANDTLRSTGAAADTLPGRAEHAGVLLDQADGTIEGFQVSGHVLREAE